MDEKYFEIPVTLITETGEFQELKTYIARGDEDSVRIRAAKVLEDEFPGEDYDYEVIEITPEEYETYETVEFLPGGNETSESEAPSARDMHDEMEDLTDRYYMLEDKLNSLPADDETNAEKVTEARLKLNSAKDYFDQYDFFKCKEALNEADAIISELTGD